MDDFDDNPIFKEFNKKLFEISEKEISRHTIALMTPGSGFIKPLGSGVFLELQGLYFIFTAAHVVKAYPKLLVQGPSGVIFLNSPEAEIYFIEDTKLDIAFIKILPALGSFLSLMYNPLKNDKVYVTHQPVRDNRYALIGFPGSRVRHKGERMKLACNTYVLQSSPDKVYNYYIKPKSDYYLLSMHGKTLNNLGEVYKAKSPKGMSGCGLWVMSYEVVEKQMKLSYHLIGIFTEKINGKYLAFSATNVNHVFNLIEHHYSLWVSKQRYANKK